MADRALARTAVAALAVRDGALALPLLDLAASGRSDPLAHAVPLGRREDRSSPHQLELLGVRQMYEHVRGDQYWIAATGVLADSGLR